MNDYEVVVNNKIVEVTVNESQPVEIIAIERGPTGPTGKTGPKGEQGIQGVQGIQGIKGDTGIQGAKGDTGLQGIQGIKGDQGVKGDIGLQGLKGDQGIQGEVGPKGEDGVDGTMSFEDLTPEQKLTLKGEQGIHGEQGLQGIQGEQGEKGADGYTPIKGIDYFDGIDGEQGPKGDPGDGADIEIIDNLISTSITSALSANQGKVLNDIVTTHKADYNNHNHNLESKYDKIYYINNLTGNDLNNGTSVATAFKTFAKAVSLLPRYIRHSYTIKIIGNLNENILLENLTVSNSLTIIGNTNTQSNQVLGNLIQIKSCTGLITISYLQMTNQIQLISCNNVLINQNILNGSTGVNCVSSSAKISYCVFSNTNYSILANLSRVLSQANTGTGGNYGLYSLDGATISKRGTQPTGTIANELTVDGGVIR